MKKIALLSALLSLGLFVAGCDNKPKPAGTGAGAGGAGMTGPAPSTVNTDNTDTTTPDAMPHDADMKDGADANGAATGDTDGAADADAANPDTDAADATKDKEE